LVSVIHEANNQFKEVSPEAVMEIYFPKYFSYLINYKYLVYFIFKFKFVKGLYKLFTEKMKDNPNKCITISRIHGRDTHFFN